MLNWLLEQQWLISLVLVTLITLEAKAIKSLGASTVYGLWWLVPLAIIVNNLPQNVIYVDDRSVYRYIVELNNTEALTQLSVNWTLLWLIGCIVIISLSALAQWKIHRLVRYESKAVTSNFAIPSRLSVVSHDEVAGPLLTGIIKPTLLLPQNFASQFSPRQQQLMINHELVHLYRGDNLYNLLALIFVALFWFNPLTWLAYRAFRRNQELACDARVLKQSSQEDKVSYSKALVQCAEHSLHSFSIYSPYGEKHTMRKRIVNIQQSSKIKPALVGLSIALSSTLLAGVALANLANTAHSVDNKAFMASPVMRVEPLYPVQAAQNKQEGGVILQFDISEDGSTDNIQVLEAFPQNVFERESVIALKQWKYKPRIQGGKAQRQTGLKVQLDYRLNNPYQEQSAQTSSLEKIEVKSH